MAVLVLEDVYKSFGGTPVLRGASLRVEESGIVGLVGPNGAGKTTLIRVGLGILSRDSGRVELMGRDPFRDPGSRERVGIVFERPSLPSSVPVRVFLEYAARLLGVPRSRVGEAIRLAGLRGHEWKPFKALSAGLKQRAVIAHALLGEPVFIVADEPTSNLDPVERVRLLNLIAELNRDHGITFLFSSHVLPEVVRIADEIAVVYSGRVVSRGRPEEVLGGLRRARVRSSDNNRLVEVLSGYGLEAWVEGLSVVVELGGVEGQARLMEALAEAASSGVVFYGVDFVEASLEAELVRRSG